MSELNAVCQHGGLKRKCEICTRDDEIERLQRGLEDVVNWKNFGSSADLEVRAIASNYLRGGDRGRYVPPDETTEHPCSFPGCIRDDEDHARHTEETTAQHDPCPKCGADVCHGVGCSGSDPDCPVYLGSLGRL